MKVLYLTITLLLTTLTSSATIHIVNVWDGYFQFVDEINWSPNITIELGDTVQWLPLDVPAMVHTITSTNIPSGAEAFDQIWQAPADTFFQYVPQVLGLYEYECTPHAISWGMIGSITVIEEALGIFNLEISDSEFTIFPNPASDMITLRGEKLKLGMAVKIFNLTGRLVKTFAVDDLNLSVSDVASGSYILSVEMDGEVYIRKLVVER